MTEYLALGLDILILAGLGGFIYYALRLSKALDVFRTYRGDFENVMNQLTVHIDEAQKAIEELKTTSSTSGAELRKLVKDAQFLADDLEFMHETGNKLAERLENAGKAHRPNAKAFDEDNISDLSEHRPAAKKPAKKAKSKKAKAVAEDEFAIQDHEYEEGGDDSAAVAELMSEAEKELYKALKKTQS